MYYLSSENKGADPLSSSAALFSHLQKKQTKKKRFSHDVAQ